MGVDPMDVMATREDEVDCMKKADEGKSESVDYIEKQEVREMTKEYEVCLVKDQYGLGIYFTRNDDMAVVDQHVPFYKLPSGLPAPGEACGCIKPGDILIGINGADVRSYPFEAIVEKLRNLELGSTMLKFRSPAYLPLVEVSMALDEDDCAKMMRLEKRNIWLEQELRRERKCRALVDKKVDLYKEEVLRLSQENVELRVEMTRSKNLVRSKDDFIACTHLLL